MMPSGGLKVRRGVLYAQAEAEGTRRRNPYDTIVEGIGLNRLTANFAAASVDDAVRGTDQEAVLMVLTFFSSCKRTTGRKRGFSK